MCSLFGKLNQERLSRPGHLVGLSLKSRWHAFLIKKVGRTLGAHVLRVTSVRRQEKPSVYTQSCPFLPISGPNLVLTGKETSAKLRQRKGMDSTMCCSGSPGSACFGEGVSERDRKYPQT